MNKENFSTMPNFEEWTDEQLEEYLIKEHNEFLKEHAIKTFQDIVDKYSYWLSKEVISKDEFDLFINLHKMFWQENEN